jgi:hypothetical protein
MTTKGEAYEELNQMMEIAMRAIAAIDRSLGESKPNFPMNAYSYSTLERNR